MILTAEELELLLKVPTTIEQAHQIIKRNQALLDAIDGGEPYEGSVGCPHCGVGYPCLNCGWQIALPFDVARHHHRYPCCAAKFGGLKLCDCCSIMYSNDSEYYKVPFRYDPSDPDANEYGDVIDEEDIDKARTFLRGHIEWAMEVIRVGGVPWPAKVVKETEE